MLNWENDKRWANRFLPAIKGILGTHLICEAPIEEDAERNTDLIVLRLEAVRIACRVRRHDYLSVFGHEFTVRSGRPSGIKTELTKIIEGWGDYFFYGFADKSDAMLAQWFLGYLGAFRLWFNRNLSQGKKPWITRDNIDGSSSFCSFRVDNIPDFIIARGGTSTAAKVLEATGFTK